MDTQNFNNQTADEALVMISELENKVEDKMLPPAHPSSIQPKKISKDIQKLSKMLKKDNFNKENLHMLRTFFCSCQFSEDGLATASEYESVVSKANTSLSKLTLDQIIKVRTI